MSPLNRHSRYPEAWAPVNSIFALQPVLPRVYSFWPCVARLCLEGYSHSMSNTILWYDLETFGLNPQYDRIAQFACIRTDENLEEIDEPIRIYCKPTLDYLPAPSACKVHGITPQMALELGIDEYDFALKIHEEFSVPGTTTAGYNSINFDDEFIRHLFYRNLLDPYEREYANGNSRWDLINLVRAAHDLRPDGIVWPQDNDGYPVFKLEALTKANGLLHESAHDALSDIRATIAMARLNKGQTVAPVCMVLFAPQA